MKTLGLLGGMSWESTATYYTLINQGVRNRLGGLHSAQAILWSFDFAEIEVLQAAGDWAAATHKLVDAAQRLEHAGAEALLICTNTMHKMADEVAQSVSIPLIHLADTTAHAIKAKGHAKPLLLGTAFTMEQDFYRGRLASMYGLDVRTPNAQGRADVHRIIYDELCQGVIQTASRETYISVIEQGAAQGADSVIFGCTEIGLLLSEQDSPLPVYDTTTLHAAAAVDFAIGQ